LAIEEVVQRSLKALPSLLAGEMDKATLLIHTSKPPRPKPPRPANLSTPTTDSKTNEQEDTP
jgi:PTH1 family peptidyl-tRNA hydrolase